MGPDPAFNNRRKQLVLQAMRHGLPAAYASREYAEAGGLLSYGTDFLDTYRCGWSLLSGRKGTASVLVAGNPRCASMSR